MTNNTKSLSLDEEIAEFQRDTHPFREICKCERCDSIPDNWKLIDKLIADRARLLAERDKLNALWKSAEGSVGRLFAIIKSYEDLYGELKSNKGE